MQQTQAPDTYDFRQYDQIWQRVSPTLDPYPGMRAETAPAYPTPIFPGTQTASGQTVSPPPSASSAAALAPPAPETSLPGAAANPCCMGSAALDMIEVLQGFIEGELADRRYYMAFAQQAPPWARQILRETGEDEGAHARRLLAVYYLITGQCYRPAVSYDRICIGPLCPALRMRYHEEACGGFNYARAAEGTTDPCLAKILNELSGEEYVHAERMTSLLERAMRQR